MRRAPRYVHDVETHNRRAADQVVPWIMEHFAPSTVLDVGCGLGTWSAVFADHGCEVLGLDSQEVPEGLLEISPDLFRVVDLEGELESVGRFDMAVCLEVAEHISEAGGHRLVEFLTAAADTVVFSAAVPGQGGTNHVNEQWPVYWQGLFRARGFLFDDSIRWHFWGNERVEWWYRQNVLIARRGAADMGEMRAVVHPDLLTRKNRALNDMYRGRVPLRTGALVFLRSLLWALRGTPDE